MKKMNYRRPIIYALCLSLVLFLFVNFFLDKPLAAAEVNKDITAFNSTGPLIKSANAHLKEFSSIKREDIRIVPGGQSIGVQMDMLGVLVVGHHFVHGEDGKYSPGEDAKVLVGDVIVEVNGTPIENMNEIKSFVEESGANKEELKVKLKRDGQTVETVLKPIFDESEGAYKIGLYIRDSAAGIGTMTFYDPESKRYGALGHVISDINTKKPIETNGGTIIRSSITSIEKGDRGTPGEKHANFSPHSSQLGNIIKNTAYGIFGVLDKGMSNGHYDEALPITRPDEVKEGPAQILTVVNDENVEVFDIEITESNPQEKADIKGMIIEIKDKNLLERTGGIVQGMSGSPIIQEGKIVGAVTHVFVNDPTSGYGVHIEWMLEDAGIKFAETLKNVS